MMKLLSRNNLLYLVLALLVFQTHQDCVNLCYNRQAGGGQCDICYFQCSNSAEAYFTSCRYENELTGDSKDLTESQCYSYCYPEMLKEIQTLQQVSEKLHIDQGPQKISTSLHQVSNGELQKELEKDERDMDIIIFVMAAGCAIFTIISIVLIIRCFESKDEEKQTMRTKYSENEDKDLPDIHVDSSSSYYSTEDVSQKVNL